MSGSNSGGLDVSDLLRQALANLAQAGGPPTVQMPQVTAPPGADMGPPTSLLGRIGEAIGGSASGYIPMTSEQRNAQGFRNLMDFFGGMAARPFGGPGVGIAEGVGRAEQAAQQPLVQTEALSKLANEQQNTQLARVKAATDLLNSQIQLQMLGYRLNMPPLYGSNTGGPGGGPGGGPAGGGGDGGDIYSLPKDQFLKAVAQRESGGNPSILNYVARNDPTAYARGATASGKYQMVNSTWQTAAKAAGVDTTKYPRAMDAPETVQDQVASKLYDMQGTAPWNPAKFGANWVQQPGGGYQLVKGAPPPGQVAQQPPATPAQPATAPPAASGGRDTAALPVPPQPPPGAVPTVSTPEEAKATAAAAGTPVQVPNTQGLWATPSGGMTSTPRLIMPGTDVASLTPTAPATTGPQPPPGVVPPAPQPPAQQPPAQPSPTPGPQIAPVRDLSKMDPHDFTLPEWQQYYRHVPTTDELVQRGIVLPQNAPEFRDAEQALTEAETNAANERAAAQSAANMAQRGALGQTDVTKAIQAATAADKNAQDAREKFNALLHDTSKTNATGLAKYYTDQDAALAADYKAQVVDPANTAKQQQQASDLKIHEGLVAAGTADDQKILQGIDTTTESAHDTLATLEAAKQLSVAAGNKSALAVLAPGLATMLQRSGLLSQDESNKLDAQKALDGVLSKMAGTMRTSMGFSRMTNMDLTFLQNMVGTSNIPESQRNAMFAFMQTALERQYQYGALVRENYGGGPNAGGMSLAKAREAADDKLGHIVQTVPQGLPPDQGDLFVQQHVAPGTFYVRDGQLRIRGQQ